VLQDFVGTRSQFAERGLSSVHIFPILYHVTGLSIALFPCLEIQQLDTLRPYRRMFISGFKPISDVLHYKIEGISFLRITIAVP